MISQIYYNSKYFYYQTKSVNTGQLYFNVVLRLYLKTLLYFEEICVLL